MSKTKLRQATYSINQLVKPLTGISEKTKADMRIILVSVIKDLQNQGYKLSHIKQLKPKHIEALVPLWLSQNNSSGTIKNKMAKLRLTTKLIDKANIVKRSNDQYHIPRRSYIPTHNKAITHIDLTKITDPYIRLSIEAQQLFGLRREEAIKLIPSQAYQGEKLHLQKTWTKGGIERYVPIVSKEQHEFLQRAIAFVGKNKSLIPAHLNNKNQVNKYISETRRLGLRNLHGLRHAYAQRRYRELSQQLSGAAHECPLRGGKAYKEMSYKERLIDRKVRQLLTRELGHCRIAVLKNYGL